MLIKYPTAKNRILFLTFILLTLTLTSFIAAAAPEQAAAPNSGVQRLLNQAEENGSVRIIVGLDVNFTPEGDLSGPSAVQSQQLAIAAAQDQVWQSLADTGAALNAAYQYIPYMALTVDAAALDALIGLPQVTHIEEDRLSAPALASSVPVIGADTAWANGATGSGQAVAILDTGVDKTHDFFNGGKVVSEACYSSNGSDAVNGTWVTVCPDHSEASTAVGSGIDCIAAAAGYPGAQDNCQHGTHVAGIAAGNPSSGSNIGVAKGADIIAIQVFTLFKKYDAALSWSSDQISGLERVYALRNTYDIAAVNMSLGGGRYYDQAFCDSDNPSIKTAIDNLRAAGIATVISSGNESYTDSMGAPGCISSAVSVGATYDWDDVTYFSNVASFLDVYAPGYSITSSVPGGGTESWPGTSMSAPHVAGAWAIIKEAAPNATVDEVLAAFKDTGTLVDDTRSGGTVQNIPRINVDLALDLFKPSAADDGAPTPLNTAVTIDVLANDYNPAGGALTLQTVTAPASGGTANIVANKIEYTPPNTYQGIDTFNYTFSDVNSNSATGAVTVIVDPDIVYLPTILKE